MPTGSWRRAPCGLVAGAAALYVLWPLIAQLLRLSRTLGDEGGGGGGGGVSRSRRPPGLANVGNTCYVNCLMQSLASCRRFLNDLRSLSDRHCRLSDCLLRILRQLDDNDDGGGGGGESSTRRPPGEGADVCELLDCLRSQRWVISPAQQDSHEFYSVLMQSLNEELHRAFVDSDIFVDSVREVAAGEEAGAGASDSRCNDAAAAAAAAGRCPPRSWLNCGLCATDIRCMSCGHSFPVRLEIHHCLTVPLPPAAPQRASLEFLLQQSFRSELIRDARCDACRRTVTLRKSVKVARAPVTLAVHLQRVAWSSAGCAVKSCLEVSFPKILDLRPVMHSCLAASTSCEQQQLQSGGLHASSKLYRLAAVVAHLGDEQCGHFVAYRLHAGHWWCVSDEHVRRVSESAVLAVTNVYMLFYELL